MRRWVLIMVFLAAAGGAFGGYAGKIAFTSFRDGNPEVYVMNADGTGVVRITNNKAYDDQPALSPDGSLLVFVSDRDGNHELYLAQANGKGSEKRLTDTSYSELDPSFSADGEWVIFTSMAEGDKDVWRLNVIGGELEKLVTADGDQFMARAAADGALAYVEDGGDEEVFLLKDGRETNLSNSPGIDTMPSFSSDGGQVYFTSQRGGDYDLFVVGRDGAGLQEVVTLESLEGRASASPDGAYLALASDMDGDLEIYVFSTAGEKLGRLTDNDVDDYEPCWSR